MTASFTDVFEIHHHEKKYIKRKKSINKKLQNSIENSYDLTLFYQGIENLQLSKKMFDQEDEKTNSTIRNFISYQCFRYARSCQTIND